MTEGGPTKAQRHQDAVKEVLRDYQGQRSVEEIGDVAKRVTGLYRSRLVLPDTPPLILVAASGGNRAINVGMAEGLITSPYQIPPAMFTFETRGYPGNVDNVRIKRINPGFNFMQPVSPAVIDEELMTVFDVTADLTTPAGTKQTQTKMRYAFAPTVEGAQGNRKFPRDDQLVGTQLYPPDALAAPATIIFYTVNGVNAKKWRKDIYDAIHPAESAHNREFFRRTHPTQGGIPGAEEHRERGRRKLQDN